MTNVRIPKALCAAVGDLLQGSHPTLEALFEEAGAPGPPPDLAHHSKWKTWLYRAGEDPDVDSLDVLGKLLEEFMDLPPLPGTNAAAEFLGIESDPVEQYNNQKERINTVLEQHGLTYFPGGRVMPGGSPSPDQQTAVSGQAVVPFKPSSVEELIKILIRGLPRAMQPFTHRRKGVPTLSISSEYDIQDLLHSQLRPWISDIRPEEFTPSYAGTSTRMDFLLPQHNLVIETKRVRDKSHGRKLGDELIIDIEHYRRHPACDSLWCVIYDPDKYMENPTGLATDLEGERNTSDGSVLVSVFYFS